MNIPVILHMRLMLLGLTNGNYDMFFMDSHPCSTPLPVMSMFGGYHRRSTLLRQGNGCIHQHNYTGPFDRINSCIFGNRKNIECDEVSMAVAALNGINYREAQT